MGLFDRFKRKNNDEELERHKKENEALKREIALQSHLIKIQERQFQKLSKKTNNKPNDARNGDGISQMKTRKFSKKFHRNLKGEDLKKLKNYDYYSIPRRYVMDSKKWVHTNKNLSKSRGFEFPFECLVEMIKMFKKGKRPSDMIKENKLLSDYSRQNLNTYLYMWRCNSFNDCILEIAPLLGYNATSLVSKELI